MDLSEIFRIANKEEIKREKEEERSIGEKYEQKIREKV